MPRHEKRFQPNVITLEPRRTPSGTTTGLELTPNDGVIVSEPPEMPNGPEAFVPEGPFFIGYDSLIGDANANLPGSPYYMSGQVGPNPEPPVYTDPIPSAPPLSDADLDNAFQKMLDSLPPPR